VLDLLASSMTFVALRFALEPPDREHRFGHGKLEAVAGLAQSFIIVGSAIYVGFEAVRRLLDPAPVEAPVAGMLVMVVSLVLTIALLLFQRHVVRRTQSIAVSADALHYGSDVLMNIAVLAAIGLSAWLDWHVADPVLGLVVVAIILISARAIVLTSLDVLLDRELPSESRAEIVRLANRHDEVLGVHDLKTRTSGAHDFIQLHIELAPELTLERGHVISDEVEAELKRAFPRAEVIIHVDPFGVDEPQDEF
jgi:ferrous-iron efflux pump FieF